MTTAIATAQAIVLSVSTTPPAAFVAILGAGFCMDCGAARD